MRVQGPNTEASSGYANGRIRGVITHQAVPTSTRPPFRHTGVRDHRDTMGRVVRRASASVMVTPTLSLLDRIRTRQANIGVIGLGYVGLPLAVEFAKAGFHVTGFDVDSCKSTQINSGASYIPDVSSAELAEVVRAGTLRATTDMSLLGSMDAIDICVP